MHLSERDKTCSPRYRQGTVFGARCVIWQPLLGNAPDVDLPLIRQTFPNLPAGAIDRPPLAPPPGSWMQLPQALQAIGSFR